MNSPLTRDKSDLDPYIAASSSHPMSNLFGFLMHRYRGNQAIRVIWSVEQHADCLIEAFAQLRFLSWIAGVDDASFRFHNDTATLDVCHDIATPGLEFDVEYMVLADVRTSHRRLSFCDSFFEALVLQPTTNVELLGMFPIRVQMHLFRTQFE